MKSHFHANLRVLARFGESGGQATFDGEPLGSSAAPADPGVAHVRSDGSDTTGDGSPAAPFLTIQKAYDEGFTYIDRGPGVTGSLVTDAHAILHFRGRDGKTPVGDISTNGLNLELHLQNIAFNNILVTGPGPGSSAGNLTIYSDALSSVNSLNAGGMNGGLDEDGGDAGTIVINGPLRVTTEVIVTAGLGSGEGQNGSDGTVTLTGFPQIPAPNPVSATTSGAIINGVVITGATYP